MGVPRMGETRVGRFDRRSKAAVGSSQNGKSEDSRRDGLESKQVENGGKVMVACPASLRSKHKLTRVQLDREELSSEGRFSDGRLNNWSYGDKGEGKHGNHDSMR